jgi:hypothetical protein
MWSMNACGVDDRFHAFRSHTQCAWIGEVHHMSCGREWAKVNADDLMICGKRTKNDAAHSARTASQ